MCSVVGRARQPALLPRPHLVQPVAVQAPVGQLSAAQLAQVHCHRSALGSRRGVARLEQLVQPRLGLQALPGHMVLKGAVRQIFLAPAIKPPAGKQRAGDTRGAQDDAASVRRWRVLQKAECVLVPAQGTAASAPRFWRSWEAGRCSLRLEGAGICGALRFFWQNSGRGLGHLSLYG